MELFILINTDSEKAFKILKHGKNFEIGEQLGGTDSTREH